ncbi:MAG: hypothetical protein JXB23_09665 [Candidatus Aminicenantes bacterium]|nr:hypothetical protein [Candidatus Aminicenantes bacterium]
MKKMRSALAFLAIGVLLSGWGCRSKAKDDEVYELRAKLMGGIILQQATACVSQSKDYISAWEYAKVTGDDFETAAQHILGDQLTENKNMFMTGRSKIEEILEKIGNPPQKFSKAHEKLLSMHEFYLELHTLALHPSKTREKYEDSVNEIVRNIRDAGEEFYSLLDE